MIQKKTGTAFFRLLSVLTVITLLGPSIALGSLLTLQVGEKPKDVAINITTSRAVVVNEKDDTVSIIDLSASAVIATVAVGERPAGVAVNEQTNKAVVANIKDNTLSIIDLDNFTVTASVDVGEDPESVAINRLTNKAYVANRKDDTISVIDLNTMTVRALIPTNRDPSGIAIYQSDNKGIVASEKDGSIQVFDLGTNSLVSTIPVGKNPSSLAINEAMGTVLVANEKDNTITIINIATSTVIATIGVSKDPEKIAVNPETGRALVTSSKEDQISIIDLSANTVIGEITTGEEPCSVAVNRTNNTAIITNSDDNSVSIIDLNTIPYTSSTPTGEKPNGVDINHKNNIAVVANEKSDNVSIIDMKSGTVLNTVDTDKKPVAVSINPKTNHALVVNKKSNTLNVVDISTGTIIASIQTGRDPVAVAVNETTNQALVANKKDNNVSVIDLNTNALISYIDVGKSPHGVAIDPGINGAIVANKKDDTVSIIDLTSENILYTADVGKNPVDVKVNENTHIAAVVSKKDDTVSIIDMNTGAVLSTVPVGEDPKGIAINSRTNQALIANHHDRNILVLDLSTYTIIDTIQIGIEARKIAVNRTNNTAVLTGEDSDGATIIRLSGNDVVPPNVTITSHQNGQTVTSSPITISGTVDDLQTEIYAGSIQADVINNTFTIGGIELVTGANQITITANDIAGNNSTVNITLILGTNPPVPDIDPLPVITDECAATVSAMPTATDAAGNQVTATTTDPLTFAAQGTHTIIWTYDDGNGNASRQSQTVIVNDITAPVPDLSPLPIIEGEGSVTVSTAPTATDNCIGTVTGTTTDNLTYSTVGDHIINWTYDDGNSNVSSQQQIVRVNDFTPPVITLDPTPPYISDITLNLTGSIECSTETTMGFQGQSVIIPAGGGTFSFTVNLTEGLNSLTVTAADSVDNTAEENILVTLDTTAPMLQITSPISGAVIGENVVAVSGTVTDATPTMVNINGVDAVVTGGSFSVDSISLMEGNNTIIATATDAAGNSGADQISVTNVLSITLQITSPSDGAAVNRSDVSVRGTVTNTTGNETGVTVNGALAVVYNGEFFVNHLTLQDGQNTITANVTDTEGNTASHSIVVDAVTTYPHVTLKANIESGVAPLTAYFSVSTSIPNSVSTYDFDYEGDSVVDYTGTTFDDISITYSTEGIYYPTVTVTDDASNTYTDTTAIILLNRASLDSLLENKWNDMKMALSNQDVAGAVDYFTAELQGHYNDIFSVLYDQLPQLVQDMQGIQLIYANNNSAKYRIRKNEFYGGQSVTITYYIYFVIDENGLWKIYRY